MLQETSEFGYEADTFCPSELPEFTLGTRHRNISEGPLPTTGHQVHVFPGDTGTGPSPTLPDPETHSHTPGLGPERGLHGEGHTKGCREEEGSAGRWLLSEGSWEAGRFALARSKISPHYMETIPERSFLIRDAKAEMNKRSNSSRNHSDGDRNKRLTMQQ